MNYENNLENVNILILGDIMLDEYIVGKVERISPEAPVPIVEIIDTYSTLGGCGNVVKNIRSIGCNCDCITQIANDETGLKILKKLKKINVNDKYIIKNDKLKNTIKKTRIVDDSQRTQLLRIDQEEIIENSIDNYLYFIKNINFDIYDLIIVSDYGKGFINENLMNFLKTKNKRIIIDPKPKNKKLYHNVFMMTPNKKEWKEIKDEKYDDVEYILNTIGKDGMVLYENKNNNKHPIKILTNKKTVFNVSGAGDTVIAILSCCISMGIPIIKSCSIANEAAQMVIQQPGTSCISKETFLSFLNF